MTADLRLNGSMLLRVEADDETYRRMIDAFLDAGYQIEGLSEEEATIVELAMDEADAQRVLEVASSTGLPEVTGRCDVCGRTTTHAVLMPCRGIRPSGIPCHGRFIRL